MPPRPLPDLLGVYYSIVEGAGLGHPSNNIFTFRVDPGPATGAADIAAGLVVATAIHDHWPTFATAAYPQAYEGTAVKTYALHTPLAPAHVLDMLAPGSIIGATAAVMVGACIKHNVVRRGKGSQSRTTISPLSESSVDSPATSITDSYQTFLTAAFIAFINSVETDVGTALSASCSYVQLSKGTPSLSPATYVIASSAAEKKLTTQRRRAQR